MTIDEFREERIEGRERLLKKIIVTFESIKPVAIHQFGSGAYGYKDEFSDLDLWFTFKDNDIEKIVKNRAKIFESISPILLKHQSKTWSPLGGNATLIIHQTEFGLFQVDYYISKLSETIIKRGAKLLYGSDLLKRGEWRLNKDARESVTFKKDITLLTVLAFVSIKGVTRKWKRGEFEKTIQEVYKRVHKGRELTLRKLSFKFINNLLNNLYPLANKKQKRAIIKIKNYAKHIESLYLHW